MTKFSIGVIGHRDVIFTEAHKQAIIKFFNDINAKYPKSPVTLLSQLAIGADTDVAKVFLELKNETSRDYKLIVPIPYDLVYYKKIQFTTAAQLKTFETILNQAERSFVLNTISEENKKILDEDINISIKELKKYHRLGGEFIVDNTIFLIALWDGIDNKKEGGTSGTVAYKKANLLSKHLLEEILGEESSLISIICKRKKI